MLSSDHTMFTKMEKQAFRTKPKNKTKHKRNSSRDSTKSAVSKRRCLQSKRQRITKHLNTTSVYENIVAQETFEWQRAKDLHHLTLSGMNSSGDTSFYAERFGVEFLERRWKIRSAVSIWKTARFTHPSLFERNGLLDSSFLEHLIYGNFSNPDEPLLYYVLSKGFENLGHFLTEGGQSLLADGLAPAIQASNLAIVRSCLRIGATKDDVWKYALSGCVTPRVAFLRRLFNEVGAPDRQSQVMIQNMKDFLTPSLLRLMLDMGADINARDKGGRTALHLVAENEFTHFLFDAGHDAVSLLLAFEADPNALDANGMNFLHYKASLKQYDIYHFLRKYMACVDDLWIKDKFGMTVRDYVVEVGLIEWRERHILELISRTHLCNLYDRDEVYLPRDLWEIVLACVFERGVIHA